VSSPTASLAAAPESSALKPTRLPVAYWPVLLVLVAAVLWAASLPSVHIGAMTDVGLVSVLPPAMFVALIVLTLSFCVTLQGQELRVPMLLLHALVLILMLYGVTALVEPEPRFAVAWRHVGIADYIMQHGAVDPRIDAYFNWPGFFILSAFITRIAGVQSPLGAIAWAPVVFNLLYLGPLLMILQAATQDRRLVWLGVWFFYLSNWIGQDYFSPQALNYFFYLVVLAILVTWFKTRVGSLAEQRWAGHGRLERWSRKVDGWLPSWGAAQPDVPPKASQPGQRMGLMAIAVAVFVTDVSGHQLTPFGALLSVTALVVFNRCTARGLPVLMALAIVAWLTFMAYAYVSGHFANVVSSAGDITQSASVNVVSRVQGSQQHLFVVYMRLLMTGAIWVLALLGGIRRCRKGYRDLTYALLAVAPFPLFLLQSYGGEVLLRVYLFALPAMAFFVAAHFYTTPTVGTGWRTTAMISVTSLALLGGFLFTRYGNERMDYMTSEEVQVVERLYQVARPGSLLVAMAPDLPWKFRNYADYHTVTVGGTPEWQRLDATDKDVSVSAVMRIIARRLHDRKYPHAYLIITRSQIANADLFGIFPHGLIKRVETALTKSRTFRVVFANRDGGIFELATHAGGAGP
jgi:hypothetical protein